MAEGKIFVGRKAELEQFKEVLKNPKGQAVLVVGQAGMGKTWLVNKMAEIAENNPKLKCGWVRYEVTPTDSVDSTMALMMDNAFEAASTEPGSFDRVPERKKQWLALFKTIVPKGGEIAELINSLRRDPTKNTRDQFLGRLRLISKRMPDKGRAIFVIDPEKYMQADSDQSWAIVVKELPEKIKFVFAQRPEDVLVDSETFGDLTNVVSIPEKRLDVLEEESVDELLTIRGKGLKCTVTEVREVLGRYEGHPYALGAALDLIEGGTKLEDLPEKPKPTKFAEVQWREVSNRSEDAIRLFKAYAILEVGVPDDVVEAVSEIDSDKRQHLVADKYIRGLLREEGEGRRIYHAILMDYIVEQIVEAERKDYHGRVVDVYRGKLAKAKKEQIRPDALAALRLAEHVLAVEGKEAIVDAFVNECYGPLMILGLLDSAMNLSERTLGIVKEGSAEEAKVRGNLGCIYRRMGELDKAEDMICQALEIEQNLGQFDGIADQYGNLGLIYRTRGDLDMAVEMLKKSLFLNEQIGRKKSMALQCSNLGGIYKEKGKMSKAEQMIDESLKIYEDIDDPEGIAKQFSNLGAIYKVRGEFDKAERMYKKALEIDKKIGRVEGQAIRYNNLGVIYYDRGDFYMAEKMYIEALKIDKKTGRLEGQATRYDNLGLVYSDMGKIDKAEQMHRKALEIDEKIGRLDGMASDYGHLGLIYKTRGELDKAEKMHLRELEIREQMGDKGEMAASNYGDLGMIYYEKGDLDKAEEMYRKALEIDENIGWLKGAANEYGSLGLIFQTKGDLDKAEQMHLKSLEITKKIGLKGGIASQYGNLGLIYRKRGDIDKAKEYWEKAVELYKKIGMTQMVEKVEGWIRKIDY